MRLVIALILINGFGLSGWWGALAFCMWVVSSFFHLLTKATLSVSKP